MFDMDFGPVNNYQFQGLTFLSIYITTDPINVSGGGSLTVPQN
jgi:hypothetical protein